MMWPSGTQRLGTIFFCLAALCVLGNAYAQVLPLPPRPANALSGSGFEARVASLSLEQREKEALAQIVCGNVPNFLRKLCPLTITGVTNGITNTVTAYVTPDYLAIGSDDDYFLFPLSPSTAQAIANVTDCSLPTPRLVDEIYAAAQVKLAPLPTTPGPEMTTVPVFWKHNAMVRTQRLEALPLHPLGQLVAGHKKDVVLSARLSSSPGKVAIYGWHKTNGVPIQPLYLGHASSWVDYSQCTRLVQQSVTVNGKRMELSNLLKDPSLGEAASLINSEGPFIQTAYSTGTFSNSVPTRTNIVASFATEDSAFDERTTEFLFEPGVRIHINTPMADPSGNRAAPLLLLYALPNGNSIEQTIGRRPAEGLDWHFDIQHIGAQVRFLRRALKGRQVIAAYLEASGKSWPAWRKLHGDLDIPRAIEAVKMASHCADCDIALSGHSGGGSFIFGYLNAVEKVPKAVVRIAFLDANYGYEPSRGHREKLVQWLNATDDHFLCVLAYNDAVALLDGKHFVSETGGTWGKSHAMMADLSKDFPFECRTNAGLASCVTLRGRVQFLLKENPEKKILHTVQVERNGFIHSMLCGTSNESVGYSYFGERAYSDWIAR